MPKQHANSGSRMADEAGVIFERKSYWKNRLARSLFLQAKISEQLGVKAAYDAAVERNQAMELLHELNPDYDRDNLQQAFDMVVPFEAR